MKILVEYFKISLDCFFAVWFVVGNVWIFGGRSSAAVAPNLYRYTLSYSFTSNLLVFEGFQIISFSLCLVGCV
jgi:hypothetical protein